MHMLHSSMVGLADVILKSSCMLRCRNYACLMSYKMTNAQIQKTDAELALEALNQAYEYYTPTPVLVTEVEEPVEYYEYTAAA